MTPLRLAARELMRMHVAALFVHDTRGRLTRVNEPGGGPAARFFIGRTPQGSEWRVRDDIDDALHDELYSACVAEPSVDEFLEAPHGSAIYEQLLGRAAPVKQVEAGPAYAFPDVMLPSSGTVLLTPANVQVLHPNLTPWGEDVRRGVPIFGTLVDGQVVSVCASVRLTDEAHEAGVETAPAFRRQGYGAPAVSAWAESVRRLGVEPLYSTSWQNVASQALAERLGLVRFGADLHIT